MPNLSGFFLYSENFLSQNTLVSPNGRIKKGRNIKKLLKRNKGSTAQLRLRTSAGLLLPAFGSENGKDSAAVASVSWLTDAACPLRVHKVFLRFRNLRLEKNLSLSALVDLSMDSLGSARRSPIFLPYHTRKAPDFQVQPVRS